MRREVMMPGEVFWWTPPAQLEARRKWDEIRAAFGAGEFNGGAWSERPSRRTRLRGSRSVVREHRHFSAAVTAR